MTSLHCYRTAPRKELFALMVLASTDHREKRAKGVDVVFEEVLELKLVEALLTETGHWPPAPFTDNQRLEALRLIKEMRIKEESTFEITDPANNRP